MMHVRRLSASIPYMNWQKLCAGVTTIACDGSPVEIAGVEYDSRRVGPGDLFVAMRGGATDGNLYLDKAIAQGAAAVVTDSHDAYARLRREYGGVAVALVEQGRRALAEVSAAVFEHPARKLALSAVTGTNGKTTTAFLLESMLRSVGRTCVLIGTIETHVGSEVRESPHTTPESRDVLEIFAEGVRVGATEAVMEMSSHALEQERVWGLPVDVAVFTNLTQDHLDYHGTMENYFAAKARMFEGVGAPPPRVAVINSDDPYGRRLIVGNRASQLMTYGLEPLSGDYRAEEITLHAGETRFIFKTPNGDAPVRSSLTGRVNVYNLLAASCAAVARGSTLEEIVEGAASGASVRGRFELLPSSNTLPVVVDRSYTDDEF